MLYINSFISALKNKDRKSRVFTENGKHYTAQEVLSQSESLALYFRENGVKKNDRIVLALEPGFDFLRTIYAFMFLNATVCIIDPEMGRKNYLAKLKQYRPDHVVVDRRLILIDEHPIVKSVILKWTDTLPVFPKLEQSQLFITRGVVPVFRKHKTLPKSINRSVQEEFIEVDKQSDFLVVYTSGTLTEPKGVVHSYSSLEQSIDVLKGLLKETTNKKIATSLPHFMLLGLSSGIHVYRWNDSFSPRKKQNFIQKNGITTLFGPPADFLPWVEHLQANGEKMPRSVNSIFLGSAPVYTSFLKKLDEVGEAEVTCLYGMTEHLMVSRIKAKDKLAY